MKTRIKEKKQGAREMAHLIKYLPHEHDYLPRSLAPPKAEHIGIYLQP